MARYRVTAPDGRRFEVTAPQGASEKDVLAFLDEKMGQQPAPAEPQSKPYEGWGDYTKDLLRTAGQGLTLGAGDEILAWLRQSADKSYDDALTEERAGVDRFWQQNPGTALTAELAGGFALPGFGAARTVARAPGLLSKVARGAGIGAGYGAAGGFASGRGGFSDRVERAGQGAVFGAGVGAALPAAGNYLAKFGRRAGDAATRVTDNEESARLYFADRLRAQGLDEAQIAQELQQGQQVRQFARGAADLPETIADVSPATQRVLRGIKVGGDAEEIIEPFLGRRQAGAIDLARGAESGGQYGRLNEQLRLALGVADEELPTALERLTGRRKQDADRLFANARMASQPFDLQGVLDAYSQRAMAVPDPTVRSRLRSALAMFTQDGQYGNYGQAHYPVGNIERFHNAKVALDDMIAGARGNERRLLTRLKHDLMDEVTGNGRNPRYREALDRYASQSELLDAAELGRNFARGTETISARQWRGMSEAEKKMARRAWLAHYERTSGKKAQGPTGDFTHKLRSPDVQNQLRLLLPPTAGRRAAGGFSNRERMGELIRREQRISSTAGKVLGNSSTAEKVIDAIDVGSMVRSLRYIKDQGGLINAAVNAVADTLERLSALKGERARYLAEQLLATDPAQQAAFLAQVTMTYGRRRAERLGRIGAILRDAWAGSSGGVIGRRQEDVRL